MALEIERKFLLKTLPDLTGCPVSRIVQGYLRADEHASVRVRIRDEHARLTVKGAQKGYTRSEFEYEIPVDDARSLLGLTVGGLIEKQRYIVPIAGREWELDVFAGANAGLVVAEIELDSEQDALELPDWVADEVSEDPRFLNANLCRHPFSGWPDRDRVAIPGPRV
jgi:adenylate cyclase